MYNFAYYGRVNVYKETVGSFGRIQGYITLKYDIYPVISLRSRGPSPSSDLKKIPSRESPERPLVCMPRCLSASVVTTALSLTVLLVCFSLDSVMTSVRVDRYVCMGCQSGQSGHGATYFPTYKAAACHYARSRACNQSNRCILLVTIQSKPSDRDAGPLLAALVPQGLGHQPVPTRRAQVCHIYQSGYIPPL